MSKEIISRPSSELAQPLKDQFKTDDLQNWTKGLDTDKKPILRNALYVFLIVFGFGSIWSATAPLGGAIVGTGRVVAADKNRVIQHLEGGILDNVLVREGDKVRAGQVVAKLDTTQIDAQLNAVRLQHAIIRLQLARSRAEVSGLDAIQFPVNIDPLVANHPRVLEAIASQSDEFTSQKKFHEASIEIIDTRIEGEKINIEGSGHVLKSMQHQYKLFTKELEDYRDLFSRGQIDRPRVYATERAVVELEANMERARLSVEEAKHNMLNLEAEKKQARLAVVAEANSRLVELQKSLNQLESNISRFEDMRVRTDIISPVNGTVFRLAKRSIGAVLRPGDAILEIFPDEDELTIEVNLQVSDILKVYIGQDIDVVFPGNRAKALTPVAGKLIYISPDAVVNENNPLGSYVLRASINPGENTEDLVPGNNAEVYIQTKSQTFFDILASPVTRFGLKVFNE